MYPLQKNSFLDKKKVFLFAVLFAVLCPTLKATNKKNSGFANFPAHSVYAVSIKPAPQNDTTVYSVVSEPPLFVGGTDAMNAYIKANLKLPPDVVNGVTKGMVIVQFIVEKDGSISSIKLARSLCSPCDKEALVLTQSMPKWRPGKESGEAKRVQITLPIPFKQ